jgi:hypothetical protein
LAAYIVALFGRELSVDSLIWPLFIPVMRWGAWEWPINVVLIVTGVGAIISLRFASASLYALGIRNLLLWIVVLIPAFAERFGQYAGP